jgi:lipoprotein-releasing system permease protein
MRFETFIALRYLKSTRKGHLFSGVSWIAVMGLVIGVAALVIALSVMNGYETEVRSSFIGVFSHARVRTYLDRGLSNYESVMDSLQSNDRIVAMTPYIINKGIIRTELDQTGIFIRGVSLPSALKVSNFRDNLVTGELDFDRQPPDSTGRSWPGIVLGSSLADRLELTLGESVTLVSLAENESLSQMPQIIRFTITGILKTGFYDIDNNYAYTSLDMAAMLFQMRSQVSGIELCLDSFQIADEVVADLNDRFSHPHLAESWRDMNPNLFAWVQIQRWTFFLVLSLIILVAAFNIVAIQIMMSLDKKTEIGILKAMGATQSQIRRIFTFSGIIIGAMGTVVGSLLGFVICWLQQTYRLLALPSDVYIIDWLPVIMQGSDFLIVAVTAILLAFLASVYPASQAAKMTPVSAIRQE